MNERTSSQINTFRDPKARTTSEYIFDPLQYTGERSTSRQHQSRVSAMQSKFTPKHTQQMDTSVTRGMKKSRDNRKN